MGTHLRELSNEYHHDKMFCILVLWMKVASALEGVTSHSHGVLSLYRTALLLDFRCTSILSYIFLLQTSGTEILHDMARLNVAITRAKHKMILVGHMTSLHRYPPVHRLLEILQPQQICLIDT